MDKIILKTNDIETLLKWRDQNKDLVRKNAAPFKGIMLEFPETKINIKAYNNAGRRAFYVYIDGIRAGKITGQQRAGGLFQEKKNTTKLNKDNIQSIITVYASLMALIVYHTPAPAAAAAETNGPRRGPGTPGKAKKKSQRPGITYILRRQAAGDPAILPAGGRAKPAGAFNVRGHYRRYKNGKMVWINPYIKGSGKEKNKTYKL